MHPKLRSFLLLSPHTLKTPKLLTPHPYTHFLRPFPLSLSLSLKQLLLSLSLSLSLKQFTVKKSVNTIIICRAGRSVDWL